jgi:hypothetical protein
MAQVLLPGDVSVMVPGDRHLPLVHGHRLAGRPAARPAGADAAVRPNMNAPA